MISQGAEQVFVDELLSSYFLVSLFPNVLPVPYSFFLYFSFLLATFSSCPLILLFLFLFHSSSVLSLSYSPFYLLLLPLQSHCLFLLSSSYHSSSNPSIPWTLFFSCFSSSSFHLPAVHPNVPSFTSSIAIFYSSLLSSYPPSTCYISPPFPLPFHLFFPVLVCDCYVFPPFSLFLFFFHLSLGKLGRMAPHCILFDPHGLIKLTHTCLACVSSHFFSSSLCEWVKSCRTYWWREEERGLHAMTAKWPLAARFWLFTHHCVTFH